MDPFVVLEEFMLLICRPCGRACLLDEAETHLRTKHRTLPVSRRAEILRTIRTHTAIYSNQHELSLFEPPTTSIPAIALLEGPFKDGLKCKTCSYIARQPRLMQEHCRTVHGWENPRRKGGRTNLANPLTAKVPWRENVSCQRFFRTRGASNWFEVSTDSISPEKVHHFGELESSFLQDIKSASTKISYRTETIQNLEGKLEPNPWLRRTGWAEHLAHHNLQNLLQTTSLSASDAWAPGYEQEYSRTLQLIWDAMDCFVDAAKITCMHNNIGTAVLYEINRRDINSKPTIPFDVRLEQRTIERYLNTWKQVVGYCLRTQLWEERDRPVVEYTPLQQSLQKRLEHEISRTNDISELERPCIDYLISFLDHALPESSYDSPLLSGLAVLGIREDGGWKKPEDYTGIYSAIIKIGRMLVVRQSELESIEDPTISIFQRVREKVHRYMTVVTATRDPTPMDWIFDARSYGLKIRYSTPMAGHIDWRGSLITYRDISLNMEDLTEMLHVVVRQLDEDLHDLLFTSYDNTSLPEIPWTTAYDDASNDSVGYWFLTDDRNKWARGYEDWVVRRILSNPALKSFWLQKSENQLHFHPSTTSDYLQKTQDFREKLFFAMHILGGQPARTTELLGIRFVNTPYGGQRNIIIQNQQLCFITAYHKGYNHSSQVKIIHRFLPQELGKTLVRYLWLVRPFCEQLEVFSRTQPQPSPFLWTSSFVQESNTTSQDTPTYTLEVWPPDQARKIFQSATVRHLGIKINPSSWRHIAIAIARRYLHESFQDVLEGSSAPYEGSDADDDEIISDNPWDTQAGHSSYTSGMVYGRGMEQGLRGLAIKQEQYRKVSLAWHRFFNFSAAQRTNSRRPAMELFEAERRDVRFKRLEKLQQVNLSVRLKQFFENPKATFQANQKEAIEAVVRGESPILQVASTGGGKTLTFMLPSYCVPEGITVVISPFHALAEDLHLRCRTRSIRSCIWSASEVPTSSVVIITPESFTTKAFQDYLGRITVRQQLDRVVLDECHTILDASYDFRPQYKALGPILQETATQLVFLTATMPPRDEAEFFSTLRIQPSGMTIVRRPTTRPNIEYSAIEVASYEQVTTTVQRILRQILSYKGFDGERTKVIIYCQSRHLVNTLGKELSCAVYHAQAGEPWEKSRIVREWMAEGGAIAATSALGVGIDQPNVRCVIHAGLPRSLRDFVQESGRGGRDGQPAKSIVVYAASRTASKARLDWVSRKTEGITEFIRDSIGCRRIVLDRVMDGQTSRTSCIADEEKCDLCKQGCIPEQEVEDSWWFALEKKAQYQADEQKAEQVRTMTEVKAFEESIRQCWEDCIVCGYFQQPGREPYAAHRGRSMFCTGYGDFQPSEVWDWLDEFGRRTMEEAGKCERFSGCFRCRLPQRFCKRWEKQWEDRDVYIERPGVECSYESLLMDRVGILVRYGYKEQLIEAGVKKMRQLGVWMDKEVSIGDFVRRKVRWGGLEANGLCVLFYIAACDES